MEDEFDRILKFFSLDDKEKEERLKEVFADSVAYFERFRHTMLHGTPEEKQAAMAKVKELKTRIEAETKKICERTGLTEQQLLERARNPENFSEDQWNALSQAQKTIEDGVKEVQSELSIKPKKETAGKKKPKGPKKPKKWISS